MSWRALGERADMAFIREVLPDAGNDPFPRQPRQDQPRRQRPHTPEEDEDEESEEEPCAFVACDSMAPLRLKPRGGTGSRRHGKSGTRKRRRPAPAAPAAPSPEQSRDEKFQLLSMERAALTAVAVDMQTGWATLVETGALQRALRSRHLVVRPATWRSIRVRQEKLPLGLPLTPCDAVLSSHLTNQRLEA